VSTKDPQKRREARLRRKARDPEKYFATRREQKRRARGRKALANPKPPRTQCKNGHPERRRARPQPDLVKPPAHPRARSG
jgi:hypothetical protein